MVPDFTSLKGIAQYVSANSGKMISSQPEMTKILKSELQRLEEYIKEELQVYFDSYTPTVYKRTGDTERSITLNDPYVEGKDLCADITFDDDLANHPSVMSTETKEQPDGYTPWLLEVGWDISDRVQPRRYMFTHHPGTKGAGGNNGYITAAVKRFNRDNKYGIKVSVYRGDEQYL